jgi:hypothetical protein
LGLYLKDEDFPETRIVTPKSYTTYGPSITMGCSLSTALFRSRYTFAHAFDEASERISRKGTYTIVGTGVPRGVPAPAAARAHLVEVFGHLFEAWHRKPAGVRG